MPSIEKFYFFAQHFGGNIGVFVATTVVSRMAYLAHFSSQNNQKMTENNKIPEYAKDFKKEWLYIRGINKKCGEFIKFLVENTDSLEKVFWSSRARTLISHFKNVLEAQKMRKLQNISDFYFKYSDINNIECLEEQLDNYSDLYVDRDSYEFDEESYELNIDIDFPGFRELFKLVSLFNDKIKEEEPIYNCIPDSDSDSYSESDSDSDSD